MNQEANISIVVTLIILAMILRPLFKQLVNDDKKTNNI